MNTVRKLQQYRTVEEALWAIFRGRIVDELENGLSKRTVKALIRRYESFDDWHDKPNGVHIRIADGREVYWFD